MPRNSINSGGGLTRPGWRDDRTRRALVSLIVGGLLAGLPLVAAPVIAALGLPRWRELSPILMVATLWPYPIIVSLMPDVPEDPQALADGGPSGLEMAALPAALIVSITVYSLVTYVVLSWRARRAPA